MRNPPPRAQPVLPVPGFTTATVREMLATCQIQLSGVLLELNTKMFSLLRKPNSLLEMIWRKLLSIRVRGQVKRSVVKI